MRIELGIQTNDRRIALDLVEVDSGRFRIGLPVPVPGGALIAMGPIRVSKSVDFVPEILTFIIETSSDLDVGLLAAWLYDKLRTRPFERVVINRRVLSVVTADSIRLAIEEEMRAPSE